MAVLCQWKSDLAIILIYIFKFKLSKQIKEFGMPYVTLKDELS